MCMYIHIYIYVCMSLSLLTCAGVSATRAGGPALPALEGVQRAADLPGEARAHAALAQAARPEVPEEGPGVQQRLSRGLRGLRPRALREPLRLEHGARRGLCRYIHIYIFIYIYIYMYIDIHMYIHIYV